MWWMVNCGEGVWMIVAIYAIVAVSGPVQVRWYSQAMRLPRLSPPMIFLSASVCILGRDSLGEFAQKTCENYKEGSSLSYLMQSARTRPEQRWWLCSWWTVSLGCSVLRQLKTKLSTRKSFVTREPSCERSHYACWRQLGLLGGVAAIGSSAGCRWMIVVGVEISFRV